LTPDINFSWNYAKVFQRSNRSYCTVELPGNAMGDIQIGAEYVVNAMRAMHTEFGGKLSVVGFSQGGMIGRWALKFWPGLRVLVDDLVGVDPSNHGTLDAYPVCAPGCSPAFWQQQSGSHFLAALNAGAETWPGISYTQVYTPTDEVVFPNLDPVASSALHTGAGRISNISTLSVCPVHVADHLSMGTFDPIGYAVAADALAHPGPAETARVDRSVCLRPAMPGVDLATLPVHFGAVVAAAAQQVLLAPKVTAEPPLKPYAR
jgi:pimeloyl-ACP methyl ester carboxylesterase